MAKDAARNIIPTIGIIGGMGIEATLEFQKLIIEATKVLGYKGEGHIPPMKIDNTLKPDRSTALLDGATPPTEALIKGCNDVASSGAIIGFMPCNTAHAFLSEVDNGSSIPIVSIIEATLWYIKIHFPDTKHVGLLATDGSVKSKKVYHPLFEKEGFTIITPDDDIQKTVMAAIYDKNGVKEGVTKESINKASIPKGQHPTYRFRQGTLNLITKFPSEYTDKPKIIIAGCTEVPLALEQSDMPKGSMLIDPMKIVALAAVIICHDANVQKYVQETKPQNINKKELLGLAIKAFTETKPITPHNVQALEQAAKIKNTKPLETKEESYSSDGDSDQEPNIISKEECTDILKKYKCVIEEGQSYDKEKVLRLKFNKTNDQLVSNNHNANLISNDVRKVFRYFVNQFNLTPHTEIRAHTHDNYITLPAGNDAIKRYLRDNNVLLVQGRVRQI